MDDRDLDQILRIYSEPVVRRISSCELALTFPECSQLIAGHITEIPAWQIALPVIACVAVGGTPEPGNCVASAWFTANLASEILDDLEDRQFMPEPALPTKEQAMNLATSLVFKAFHDLSLIPDPRGACRAVQIFAEAGFKASFGQHQDLLHKPLSVEQALMNYWEAVILKSGSVFMAGAGAGAAAGTTDERSIHALAEYGTSLGVMLQLFDDCRDIFSQADGEASHEISLPVLLYLLAEGEEELRNLDVSTRGQLVELLTRKDIITAISALLLEWKGRALQQLSFLPDSPEKQVLEKIPALFLERHRVGQSEEPDGDPS